MYGKLQVTLSPAQVYTLYVDAERVEIVAIIDGHAARFGSARWDGSTLRECTAPLRPAVLNAICDALHGNEGIERASTRPSERPMRSARA